MLNDVTIFIAAGGKSSRMGQDKGLMNLNGIPMVQHLINTVKSIDCPIVLLTNNPGYNVFELPVWPDVVKDAGPMGALYTALKYSRSTFNMLLSCDTPFITPQILQALLQIESDHPVTVATIQNIPNPLLGVYNQSLLDEVEKRIFCQQFKMLSLIQSVNFTPVSVDALATSSQTLLNLNTLEDVAVCTHLTAR